MAVCNFRLLNPTIGCLSVLKEWTLWLFRKYPTFYGLERFSNLCRHYFLERRLWANGLAVFAPACGSGFRAGLYQHGKWGITTINSTIKLKIFAFKYFCG